MYGEIWFAYTVACAFVVLVSRLGAHLTLVELAAGAFPVGAICSAWAVYLVACLTSAVGPHTLFGSSALLAYAAYEHFGGFRRRLPALVRAAFAAPLDSALAAACVGAAAALLVPLYSSRFIPEHDGKVWSGGSCWADLPIHMHMAQSFLEGRNKDVSWGGMASPVFAGEPMAYPFLPDFHAATLVRWGATLRNAMMIPGLTLALALIVLFFTLTVRLTGSRLGGLLAVLIAVGAGGMGGPHLAMRDGLAKAVLADTAQNDTSGDGKIVWFAFIPHVLLPQRGANFAYPMVLFVLTLVWIAGDMRRAPAPERATDAGAGAGAGADAAAGGGGSGSGAPAAGDGPAAASALAAGSSAAAPTLSSCGGVSGDDRRSMLLMSALFAGMLPLIQAHSFVALGVMIGCSFVLDFHKWVADPRLLVSWAMAGAVALGAGYPQMFLFKHQVQVGAGGHFLNVQWWYQNHEIGKPAGVLGFWHFWWMNLGPALPLFAAALALMLWELAQAQLLALERKAAALSPAQWADFYAAAVQRDEPAPLAGAGAGAAAAAAALAGASGGARGRRVRLSSVGPSARGAGAGGASALSPPSRAVRGGGRGGGGGGGLGLGADAADSAASPHVELQMRVDSAQIMYTLMDPASGDGVGHRFQLALPASSGAEGGAGGAFASGATAELTNLSTREAVQSGAKVPHARATVSHTTEQGTAEAVLASGGGGGAGAGAPANAVSAYAEYRDPKASTFFAEHLWRVAKASLRESAGIDVEAWLALERYGWDAPDRALFHLNALSLGGRGLDALKLALGALCVFLLGNAVNFQPWDRDNTKLFYCWVFVNASLSGALLAAPFEFLAAALLAPGPGAKASAAGAAVAAAAAGKDGAAAAAAAPAAGRGPSAALVHVLPGFLRLAAIASPTETAAFARVLEVAGDRSAAGAGAGSARSGLPRALFPASARAGAGPVGAGAAGGGGGDDKLGKAARSASGVGGGAVPASVALVGALGALPTLVLLCATGFMMLWREFGIYHVLLDEEQLQTGEWIKANTPPKGVFLHKDVHITPPGCLAGRPTLVAYNGWMWSHGYNYYDRDRDRAYVHENAMKDSDPQAYNALRRWGVRYVLGEHMPRHHRAGQQARDEAIAAGAAEVPAFDADLFLDGQLKRLYSNGRFDILEVLGYGFPPT